MNNNYVELLQKGQTVKCRPKGNSMQPKIYSGQQITLSPEIGEIAVDDILFCRVNGNLMIHLVTAIQGDRIQISNNHGHVNGWTTRAKVYGKVIAIED
jgi:hypothetical protein